jgi:hypothetical protein
VNRTLDALGSTTLDLQAIDGVIAAFYHGVVRSQTELAARVTTHWAAGGFAAYESGEASDDVILPIFAKDVQSLTTLVYGLNPPVGDRDNQLTFDFYEPSSGDKLLSAGFTLSPGDSTSWDPAFDLVFQNLGESYLGPVRITADEPIVVQAYGDETGAPGAAAFRARPVDAAATRQFLPLFRSGDGRETMVSIVNPERTEITVQASFVSSPDGPSGARRYETSFDIGPWGTAYMDVGRANRGNVAAPVNLPRNFVGGLHLSASGPVLAASYESVTASGANVGSAAYNAFSPGDATEKWVVPRIPRRRDEATVMLMNTTESEVSATFFFQSESGAPLGSGTATIPAYGVVPLSPASAGADGPGYASVSVTASGPIVAAVLEEPAGDHAIYQAVSLVDSTIVPTATGSAEPSPATPTATRTADATPTSTATEDPHGRNFLPWAGQR